MDTRKSDVNRLYQLAMNYNTYMPGQNQDIALGKYNRNSDADLRQLALQIIQARRGGYIPSRGNLINVNGRWGYDAGYKPLNYSDYGWGEF